MLQFTSRLKKEIDAKIEQIECSEISMITKSLDASHVLSEAFNQLKAFTLSYNFKDEDEEIFFFKETKPRLCSRLIYYRKVYNIEMNCPTGSDKKQEYLSDFLNDINKYNTKRLDFIRYYRSDSSHLDSYYFLRGKADVEQYLETFYYELDHNFSTNGDFKAAKILANDMLSVYINSKLSELDRPQVHKTVENSIIFSKEKITWTGKKAELVEQIYAWIEANSFNNGNVNIKELVNYIESVFNINLGDFYHAFLEIRERKDSRTLYLDKLIKRLNERMDNMDRK
jgi:RteC protein.